MTEMRVQQVETGARIFFDTPVELCGDLVVQMTHPSHGRLWSCALHTAFIVDRRLVLRKEDLDFVDLQSEEPLAPEFKIGLYFK